MNTTNKEAQYLLQVKTWHPVESYTSLYEIKIGSEKKKLVEPILLFPSGHIHHQIQQTFPESPPASDLQLHLLKSLYATDVLQVKNG